MLDTSTETQCFSFDIPHADVKGPLNLAETILSGQTAEPEWLRDDRSFTNAEVLNGIPVKYEVTQIGGVADFSLSVQGIAASASDEIDAILKSRVLRTLGLQDDLTSFYNEFADDGVLSLTFKNLRGLRLMRGFNLFEGLICSILSQNNSVKLWNRSARLMMKHYGQKVAFPDGSEEFIFPQPEALAKLNPRSLRSTTSMGYRAKPVVTISRLIVNGELNLSKITTQAYKDAMALLLELPGVGPKVADCFLLYGAGYLDAAPVDIWIHRIVSKLYFGGKKVSRMNTAMFLRERFGKWAGYAQLYLFDYARTGKIPAV
jgi:N-glycosylase/DNA lyase